MAIFNQELRAIEAQMRATKEATEAAEERLKLIKAARGTAAEARSKCIKEYKTLVDIENEVLEESLVTFIHGFHDRQVYL